MHVVDVSDPYFGNWLYHWLYGRHWPVVWMGPMIQSPLRIESLWQGKGVARSGHCVEKTVQHSYVDGIISVNAESEGGPPSFNVIGMKGGRVEETIGTNPLRYETWLEFTPSGDGPFSASFSVVGHQETLWYGVPMPAYTQDGTYAFTVEKAVDEYNGQVTYRSPVITSRTGCFDPGSDILVKVCPFPQGEDGVDPSIPVAMLPSWIATQLSELEPLGDRRHVRDEAIWQALDHLQLIDLNWLDDYQDLARPLAAVRRLSQGLRNRKSSAIRKIANMHLFWRYCVRTNLITAEESADLIQFLTSGAKAVIDRIQHQDMIGHGTASEVSIRSDGGSDTITYTAKAVYGAGFGGFTSLARWRLLGLLPGAGDIWDLIPLSFVVDWVFPIQKTINKLEHLADSVMLPLRYILVGRKYERELRGNYGVGNHSFNVDLTHTTYDRRVMRGLPLDMWLGKLGFRDPRKNIVTGIALGITR